MLERYARQVGRKRAKACGKLAALVMQAVGRSERAKEIEKEIRRLRDGKNDGKTERD